MKKIKRLILHLGPIKTGSTTIQNTLQNNINLLETQNIYYFSHFLKNNGLKLMRSIESPSNSVGEKILLDFIRPLHKDSTLIISFEALFNTIKDVGLIKKFFETHIDYSQISIIWYFRRQDLLMWSAYLQQFKNLRNYKNLYFDCYYDFIERSKEFINIYKFENCIIRCFDPQYFYQNNLVKDFCHHLDIDTKGFKYKEIANQALGYKSVNIMKYVHDIFVKYNIHNLIDFESDKIRERVKEFRKSLSITDDTKYFPAEQEARAYYKTHDYRKKNADFIKKYNLPWTMNEDFSMYPKISKPIDMEEEEREVLFDTHFSKFVDETYNEEDYSLIQRFAKKDTIPKKDMMVLLLAIPKDLHYAIKEGLMGLLLERKHTKEHYEHIKKKYEYLNGNKWIIFGRRSFLGKIKFIILYPLRKILHSIITKHI